MRQAVPCLALLLAAAAPGVALAGGRPMTVVDLPVDRAVGYLPSVGSPPLRFGEQPTPPALVARPSAAAPAQPVTSPGDAAAIRAAAKAAQSPASGDITLDTQLATTEEKSPAAPDAAEKTAAAPAPILPDEFRPQVRAEDFLPYFQVPASGKHPGDMTIIAPVQASAPSSSPLPQSSATYIQTDK